MRANQFIPNDSDAMHESVAGPEKCWPGHRKVGTQPGTGKNAGKRVNDCEKIGEENKGLYYNVNKRKAAGTSRPASSPKAPTAQAWKDAAKTAKNEGVAEGLNEMDKSAPQPGRDGKVSHSTYGSRDKKGSDYFKGKEAPGKPITKKQMEKHALDILKKQGVAEGVGNIGNKIRALYQKIYSAGDDAIESMYYDSPIFAQYWDEYEGDLDSIIAEVDASELQVILAELQSAVEDQGVAEGNYDRDDYYNARRGSEYGRGLAATGYGGDGSATRRDDIFKGQSKRLPADPFARTSGAVPTAGTGRIHSTALPGEMEEGEKIGNMDADRFDDAMARLKKLAGAGPMKTVYDPDRRVYRNMPTAQQPPQQPKK